MDDYRDLLKQIAVISDEMTNAVLTFQDHLPDEYRPFGRFGDSSIGWRTMGEGFGFLVFYRILTTVGSIERLLPQSRSSTGFPFVDLPSISSLVRTVIDAYCSFYYLLVDKPGQDESFARDSLWVLYYRVTNVMCARLGGNADDPRVRQEEISMEGIRASLSANSYFASLPPKEQSKYLKGEKSLFLTNQEILCRNGTNINRYRGLYKALSRYIHGHCHFAEKPQILLGDRTYMPTIDAVIAGGVEYASLALRDFANHFRTPLRDGRARVVIKHYEDLQLEDRDRHAEV